MAQIAPSSLEKIHPTSVVTVHGGVELGRQAMALRYDLVRDTLQGMLEELSRQVDADSSRGRVRLVAHLTKLQEELARSVDAANSLVEFCGPWIEAEKKA